MLVKSAVTGQAYHVTWQYEDVWGKINGGAEKLVTRCIISKINPDKTKEELARGTANCNVIDQFDKNTGRKLSLSRALITISPTIESPTPGQKQVWEPKFQRPVRYEFWAEYFRMHGKIE